MSKINSRFNNLFLFLLICLVYTSANAQVNFNGNNVSTIFQDSKGEYWIGSNGEGVYNIKDHIVFNFNISKGLSSNQITSIQEDSTGIIWVSTAIGLNSINRNNVLSKSIPIDKDSFSPRNKWEIKNNSLWFSFEEGIVQLGSFKPDIQFDNFILPRSDSDWVYMQSKIKILSPYFSYVLLKDSKQNLWFGTHYLGVCKYNGESFKWYMDKGLKGPAVRALFEDSKGNLWIGNNGRGLYKLTGDSLVNITELNGLGNSNFNSTHQLKDETKTMARVFAINEDLTGNLWIGTTDAGVWKYDGRVFTNYTVEDGLPSNTINVIYKNMKGELMFGTTAEGIYKFNGFAFYKTSF